MKRKKQPIYDIDFIVIVCECGRSHAVVKNKKTGLFTFKVTNKK